MANKTIPEYGSAGSIDPVNDQFLLYQQSTNSYRKINRNTTLGVTGSPVGTTDTQTLTNKTISGANNTITNIAPTSITGLPSVSSIVTLTGTQTLTNKTLTSPTINGGTIDSSAIVVNSITGKTSATSGSIFGLPVTAGKVGANGVVTNSITDGSVTAIKTNFGGDYSTSEVNTGFKWVDGTDIYKKTIDFGTLPNATQKSVAHGISSLAKITTMDATCLSSNNMLTYVGGTYFGTDMSNTFSFYRATATPNSITCVAMTDRSSLSAYITIYYTKT